MKLFIAAAVLAVLFAATVSVSANDNTKDKGPLQFTMKDIDGKDVELSTFKGKVVLFVNVASKCGYTPQYEGLEALYQKFSKDGLMVIGVPANEFGKQEPGSDSDIKKFCTSKYNVTFPMMSKVAVKGKDICPLYKFLTSKETNPNHGGDVAWNFEKFLVSRKGEVIGHYKSKVKPDDETFVKAVKKALESK